MLNCLPLITPSDDVTLTLYLFFRLDGITLKKTIHMTRNEQLMNHISPPMSSPNIFTRKQSVEWNFQSATLKVYLILPFWMGNWRRGLRTCTGPETSKSLSVPWLPYLVISVPWQPSAGQVMSLHRRHASISKKFSIFNNLLTILIRLSHVVYRCLL